MRTGKVKFCVGCGVVRTEDNTYVLSTGYFRGRCKECFKLFCKVYEKTLYGYLVRTYRNMKSRVNGVHKKKAHLYKGKNILDKEYFYNWSLSDKDYNKLHTEWVVSGYNHKLSPSIDRIDSNLGYTKDNIRWITHSENSRLGSLSKNC